jgi:hypothetical protein
LEYELPPDFQKVIERKLLHEPWFREAYNTNYQQTFFDSLDYRIKHGIPIIISILGQPNTGKAFSALYLAEYISKKSKIKFPNNAANVSFSSRELINSLVKSKPHETFVNMGIRAINVGLGSQSLNQELDNVKYNLLARKNNMIYVSPTLEYNWHYCILEPLGINYKKKICRVMVYDQKEMPVGLIHLPAPSSALIANFEKKKKAFAEKIITRTSSDFIEEVEKTIEKLHKDKKFMKLPTKAKKIFYVMKKYPNLPAQMHELLVELAC